MTSTLFIVSTLIATLVYGQQRAPPGVNPQQYQQQPPQGQFQQQQFQGQPPPPGQFQGQPQQFQGQPQQFQGQPPPQGQFQGQPQQFQGQPQQFQGQPQQFQGQPPPQGQFQGQPQQFQGQPQQFQGQPPQQGRQPQQGRVLHKDKKDISKEAEHMKEHEKHIDTSNMSEQELQFHYFKMHDSDGNNKLDGLELVKSLIHWHDEANHDPKSGQPIPEQKIFLDDELKNMIDPILESDDKNKDGFIDYPEFIAAQQAAAASSSP